MKKQYMTPSAAIVNIGTKTTILTGSNIVTYGKDNDGYATSDENLSRYHYSVWGDDEE